MKVFMAKWPTHVDYPLQRLIPRGMKQCMETFPLPWQYAELHDPTMPVWQQWCNVPAQDAWKLPCSAWWKNIGLASNLQSDETQSVILTLPQWFWIKPVCAFGLPCMCTVNIVPICIPSLDGSDVAIIDVPWPCHLEPSCLGAILGSIRCFAFRTANICRKHHGRIAFTIEKPWPDNELWDR